MGFELREFKLALSFNLWDVAVRVNGFEIVSWALD